MTDPQLHIRRWLNEKLETSPRGTRSQLAKALQVGPDAISRMTNLDASKELRAIKAHELQIINEFFGEEPERDAGEKRLAERPTTKSEHVARSVETAGVAITGKIQAGSWLDQTLVDENPDETSRLPIAPDPRFPHARQYALEVIGDSMDRRYAEGTFVICVDFFECGVELRNGLIVHVERMKGDLRENTLKILRRNSHGWQLEPDSNNPAHKTIFMSDDADEATEITVRGIVIGNYRREEI